MQPMTTQVSADIPTALFEQINTLSQQLDCSCDWIVQQAVIEWVSKQKITKNPWDDLLAQIPDGGFDIELPSRDENHRPNPFLQAE